MMPPEFGERIVAARYGGSSYDAKGHCAEIKGPHGAFFGSQRAPSLVYLKFLIRLGICPSPPTLYRAVTAANELKAAERMSIHAARATKGGGGGGGGAGAVGTKKRPMGTAPPKRFFGRFTDMRASAEF